MNNITLRIGVAAVLVVAVVTVMLGLYGGSETTQPKKQQASAGGPAPGAPMDISSLEAEMAEVDSILADLDSVDFNNSLDDLQIAL